MPTVQQIASKDIYHGLPVFPETTNGLSAIVVGATGISGDHMLRVLCENPGRWSKIYAMSRRPPTGQWQENVTHIPIDLSQSPSDLASLMIESKLKADYIFFFAYIQPKPKEEGGNIWSAANELVAINTGLLSNFLESLVLAKVLPKRILLQLGAKYYGGHQGPISVPQEETDPRIFLEPNFYYSQEDLLKGFCETHGIGWNTTRPSWIPGAVQDAAMNICLPLAIYATVQKHLGRPLDYPSDVQAWETNQSMSSAQLNSYFYEWAILSPNTRNESFNVTDGCAFTFGKFWPKLADRFGIPWTGPSADDHAYVVTEFGHNPPPRGFGPVGKVRARFTFTEWAKENKVQNAWKEISNQYNLVNAALGLADAERVFGFLDMAVLSSWPSHLSMSKSRKAGFFGFVDSTESIFKIFQEFVDLQMIPPLPQI
ncbi:hypothetical protein ASPFODRAFT_65849 [Aspergillus luchuensis CBS 106.47]|uniref:PRISE-like Rossmann-fold domain-containing protein n=1 Tax=Aspergillus luchuensis (strain CBS 106.47) TaxID=1137211 RepID=A0A1M3T1G2_ASPLC|nr:hypothetical protein ASPFODRAFT_65849 [Aspergillus luchuensis CBS 106.47]